MALKFQNIILQKNKEEHLAERMKDPDDELQLVIVRDMWLTGFDAPCLHTLYIDKPMRGHNLMQAIAQGKPSLQRQARRFDCRLFGYCSDLKKALSFYSDAGGKGDPTILQDKPFN